MKERIKEFLEDLFSLPRTFLAWIVFHLAKWLNMRVIENDEPNDFFDDIMDYIEDVDEEPIGLDEINLNKDKL